MQPVAIISNKVTPNTQVTKTTLAGQNKKTSDKGKAKPLGKIKKNIAKSTPNIVPTAGPSANLQSQLRDKAKHTAALIQEKTEDFTGNRRGILKGRIQDSDAIQESDLEQEDSDNLLTDSEQ